MEDESLLKELAERRIPLTLCPLSNLKLGVIKRMEDHPRKKMMDRRIIVTVNSDDPTYFGGYINENYLAVQRALNLSASDIYRLAENSFKASSMDETAKNDALEKLRRYMAEYVSNVDYEFPAARVIMPLVVTQK